MRRRSLLVFTALALAAGYFFVSGYRSSFHPSEGGADAPVEGAGGTRGRSSVARGEASPATVGEAPSGSGGISARGSTEPTEIAALLASGIAQAIIGAADVGELLETHADVPGLLREAERIAEATARCIRAGGCRAPREADQAYYDPTHGPAYRALGQALKLLVAAQSEGLGDSTLAKHDLVSNLAIPQADIQLASLELVLAPGRLDETTLSEVLERRSAVEGSAKAMYFALLQANEAENPEPRSREAISHALSQSLAEDKSDTVLEILRGMNRLTLSEPEFRSAAESLCPMIRARDPGGNWRAAGQYLRQYASRRGFADESVSKCGA